MVETEVVGGRICFADSSLGVPIWEDDIREAMGHMGSDWPHMEGLTDPRDILTELNGISRADLGKILQGNVAALNARRPPDLDFPHSET